MALRALAIACVLACAANAAAQAPSDVLRDGNAAASNGDWPRVSQLLEPLLRGQLPTADRAEAHRLAGLAAFYQGRRADADQHFLAYLRLDLDARLDRTLYPPDVVDAFEDVRLRNAAELRKLRPKPRRYFMLNLVPPAGQLQNGHRTKAVIVGGLLVGLATTNVASYLVLRSWCSSSDLTCDADKDRSRTASQLRVLNIASGVGLILTYGYGVYDGIAGYRRRETIQPFVAPASGGGMAGIMGTF